MFISVNHMVGASVGISGGHKNGVLFSFYMGSGFTLIRIGMLCIVGRIIWMKESHHQCFLTQMESYWTSVKSCGCQNALETPFLGFGTFFRRGSRCTPLLA